LEFTAINLKIACRLEPFLSVIFFKASEISVMNDGCDGLAAADLSTFIAFFLANC